jgi:predicted RNase H-like HicB family nuclease
VGLDCRLLGYYRLIAYSPQPVVRVYAISTRRRKRMKLKVVLEPSEEGGYTAHVPSLPGCISEGETMDEALTNIKEAIGLYLESVEDDWAVRENADTN